MKRPWFLVADIGGSNARFAVVPEPCRIAFSMSLPVADFPRFEDALNHFLNRVGASGEWRSSPARVCLAVACPPVGDVLRFTNSGWHIRPTSLAAQLGVAQIQLLNDFAAIAHALPGLRDEDWVSLGGGSALPGAPVAVLGPGTGLGMCAAVPVEAAQVQVLAGEGGHVDFAPQDTREEALHAHLAARYGHVSVERVLSGPGIYETYQFLAGFTGRPARQPSAQAVSAAAMAGDDVLACETMTLFCRVMGSVAGNLALTFGAGGGVYIAGGIAPQIIDLILASDCRRRFEAKGRFTDYLTEIPLRVITRERLGLLGAAAFLAQTCAG